MTSSCNTSWIYDVLDFLCDMFDLCNWSFGDLGVFLVAMRWTSVRLVSELEEFLGGQPKDELLYGEQGVNEAFLGERCVYVVCRNGSHQISCCYTCEKWLHGKHGTKYLNCECSTQIHVFP